ncbi:Retinoid X receptor, partial [Caligus rogercresseyi]
MSSCHHSLNPDAKGLCDVNKVESLREKVYATLEEYTRSVHKNEPSRFAKLLLRLPALRSIGLKCLEHLFFYKLVGDYLNEGNPLEKFIQSLLE